MKSQPNSSALGSGVTAANSRQTTNLGSKKKPALKSVASPSTSGAAAHLAGVGSPSAGPGGQRTRPVYATAQKHPHSTP